MTDPGITTRLRRAVQARMNTRRLWGATGTGLLAPPLSAFAAFGDGSMILPPTRVQAPDRISIGSRVMIQEHNWLCVVAQDGKPAPRLVIGDGTTLLRFVKVVCSGEVLIGDECLISDHSFITDTRYAHDDPRTPIAQQGLEDARPVTIGRRVFIGHRAIVGPGVTIGDNAYVGAGAVVQEDVPARTVVVGHPARVVRVYDEGSGTWMPVGPDA